MKIRCIFIALSALSALLFAGCSRWGGVNTDDEAVPAIATASDTYTTAAKTRDDRFFGTLIISEYTLPPEYETAGSEEAPSVTEELPKTAETEAATFAHAEQVVIDAPFEEYDFTDEYNQFLSECIFVGDSICSGLKVYEILPANNVIAQGNTAARNIFDFTFRSNGEDVDLLTALERLDPKYVVFSMGMNDVNMTSEEEFCENYGDLLSRTQERLPNAQLIVLSVTPVTSDAEFTTNSKIDRYNAALKDYLDSSGKGIFAEVSSEIKNSENALIDSYNSGDGVHLSPEAYYAVLYRLCGKMTG